MQLHLRYPAEMEEKSFSVFQRGKRRRRILPEFVNNTGQLRHVLAARAFRFLHKKKPLPSREELISRWRELDSDATAAVGRDKRRLKLLFAGSYLKGQAAVAYGAWRMGMRSSELAAQYGLKKGHITSLLVTMVFVANDLGYPTGNKTPRPKYRRKPGVTPMAECPRDHWRKRRAALQTPIMSGEQYGRATPLV
jgi:hypothetical protein